MSLAVLIAPYSTRTEDEAKRTDLALIWLLRRGYVPVFLPYALEKILPDETTCKDTRAKALKSSERFLRCMATIEDARFFLLSGRQTTGVLHDLGILESCGRSWTEILGVEED